MKRKISDGQADGPPTKSDITAGKEPTVNKREGSAKKTAFAPSIVDEQELLQSLHHAAILTGKDVCEEVRSKSMLPIEFDSQVIERATSVLFDTFTQSWIPDLFAFSEHAKRATIGVEDIKLLLRRNPKLCQSIETNCGIKPEASRRNSGRRPKQKNPEEPSRDSEPAGDSIRGHETEDPLNATAITPANEFCSSILDSVGLTPKPPIAQSTPLRATPHGGRSLPARRLPSPIVENDEEHSEDRLLAWEREQAMKSMEREQTSNQDRCEMDEDLFDKEPSTNTDKPPLDIRKDSSLDETHCGITAPSSAFQDHCDETMLGEQTILANLGFGEGYHPEPGSSKLCGIQETRHPTSIYREKSNDTFDSFDDEPVVATPLIPRQSDQIMRPINDDSFDNDLELIDDMPQASNSKSGSCINPFKKVNEISTNSIIKNGLKKAVNVSINTTSNKIQNLPKSSSIDNGPFDEDVNSIPPTKQNTWKTNFKEQNSTRESIGSISAKKGRAYDSFFDDDLDEIQESNSPMAKKYSSPKKENLDTTASANISPMSNLQNNASKNRLDTSNKEAKSKLGENFSAFDFFDDDNY